MSLTHSKLCGSDVTDKQRQRQRHFSPLPYTCHSTYLGLTWNTTTLSFKWAANNESNQGT